MNSGKTSSLAQNKRNALLGRPGLRPERGGIYLSGLGQSIPAGVGEGPTGQVTGSSSFLEQYSRYGTQRPLAAMAFSRIFNDFGLHVMESQMQLQSPHASGQIVR